MSGQEEGCASADSPTVCGQSSTYIRELLSICIAGKAAFLSFVSIRTYRYSLIRHNKPCASTRFIHPFPNSARIINLGPATGHERLSTFEIASADIR